MRAALSRQGGRPHRPPHVLVIPLRPSDEMDAAACGGESPDLAGATVRLGGPEQALYLDDERADLLYAVDGFEGGVPVAVGGGVRRGEGWNLGGTALDPRRTLKVDGWNYSLRRVISYILGVPGFHGKVCTP